MSAPGISHPDDTLHIEVPDMQLSRSHLGMCWQNLPRWFTQATREISGFRSHEVAIEPGRHAVYMNSVCVMVVQKQGVATSERILGKTGTKTTKRFEVEGIGALASPNKH